MADIFGYENRAVAGVFSPDATKFTVSGAVTSDGTSDSSGLLQGWNIQYQQQTTPVYSLSNKNVYWSKGYPVGTGNIDSIVVGNKLIINTNGKCDTGSTITIKEVLGVLDQAAIILQVKALTPD